MNTVKRQFKPGLVPTLVVLILLPILIRLGFWQIDRAGEKEHIQQLFEQRAQLPEVPITELAADLSDIEALKYRQVSVTGKYDNQHQILLDNKVYNQVVGYHVLTPIRINNTDKAVLVNRGWVPGSLDRRILPKISSPDQQIEINGVISIPSSKVFTLSDYNRAGDNWPAVYQWIDFKDMQHATGLNLLPVVILQDPKDKDSFVRNWSKVSLKPEKNISYAVQWFTMAFALIVIYIVVNLRKVDVSTNE